MPIQQDDREERESRYEILSERFRAEEKRKLLHRGIELWTRTEPVVTDGPVRPIAGTN